MIFIQKPGSQPLTDHESLEPRPSASDLTGLMLQNTGLINFIKSLMQYSKTLESCYGAPLDEGRTSGTCQDLVSCGLPQGAIEATYQCNVRVTRLVPRYPEPLELVENVYGEAAAKDSAAGKSGIGITRFSIVFLLKSEKQMLYFSAKLPQLTKNTKEKVSAALLSSLAFCFCAAALLDNLKAVYKTTFPAIDPRIDQFLSSLAPRTKTSSLSLKAMLLRTMSLLSREASDKSETWAACTKDCSQCLLGVVLAHFLPQQEILTMGERKKRNLLARTSTSSRCSKKFVSTKQQFLKFIFTDNE